MESTGGKNLLDFHTCPGTDFGLCNNLDHLHSPFPPTPCGPAQPRFNPGAHLGIGPTRPYQAWLNLAKSFSSP